MKQRKAAGADKKQYEIWLYSGEKIHHIVRRILEQIWNYDGFPKVCSKGVICPILKKANAPETKK